MNTIYLWELAPCTGNHQLIVGLFLQSIIYKGLHPLLFSVVVLGSHKRRLIKS
ncbi:hypothetical protein [Pedobacter sp. SG918]|uniref:hypothetical protein n=1 Tax=Pedobacter sp. SG918 TaxID=2587136 RepID=UPI0017B7E008|nr:hypothetical protein [Pedobacter sp. SG918]NMN38803.1 hypothetical protein [Pedobacter sp. SG918]